MGRRPNTDYPEYVSNLTKAIRLSSTWAEVAHRMGMNPSGGQFDRYRKECALLGIKYPHLNGTLQGPHNQFPPIVTEDPFVTPCREDSRFVSTSTRDEVVFNDIKLLCYTCPIVKECLNHALIHKIDTFVWGGTTPAERRKMRHSGVSSVSA